VRFLAVIRLVLLIVGVLVSLASVSSAEAATWIWSRPVSVDPGGGGFAGISCPSAGFCVAVDQAGRVVTSRSTAARARGWSVSAPITPGFGPLQGVTCPTDRLCLGLGEFGSVAVVSTDPAGGAGAWRLDDVGGDSFFDAIACPTTRLCVAIDTWGGHGGPRVLTTHDPANASGAWKRTPIAVPQCAGGGACGFDLTCPTSVFCAAVDASGTLLTSANPGGGSKAWKSGTFDATAAHDPPQGISCPSASLCVIGDGPGQHLLVSHHPGASAGWHTDAVGFATDWVSCPLTDLCVANQGDAFPLVSNAPLLGASSWRWSDLDHAGTLTGVSCPTRTECVAVDNSGDVVTGSALVAPRRTGGIPRIAGAPRVGATLTASAGTWSGSAPIHYEIRWQRCDPGCRPIVGAQRRSLRLTRSDLGARIRVRVTGFNAVGSTDAWSYETRPVASPIPEARP
jgi:hypothetical protein